MEDDANVRKLVEWIFIKQVKNVSEMTAPNSSMPACLLTRDFHVSMEEVLSKKKMITPYRWQKFVDTCYNNMFSSHEMYLRHIMFACQAEHKFHRDIFDSFISVCAVLRYLSEETLLKTEMNFCDLNPDIFMVFYQNDMKKRFRKRGGFHQLVEYIRGHKYFTWNPNDVPTTSVNAYRARKMVEELNKKNINELIVNSDESEAASILAKKVLSRTSVEFPLLLSKPELIRKLVAYRRKRCVEAAVKTKPVDNILAELNSNSDTETKPAAVQKKAMKKYEGIIEVVSNILPESSGQEKANNRAAKQKEVIKEYEHINEAVVEYHLPRSSGQKKPNNHAAKQKKVIKECEDINEPVIEYHLPRSSGQEKVNNRAAKQKEDIAEHEKIIEAVIRYNHSKSSGQEEANNPLLKTAYGILEHLKDNIKSFMEVLDEYNEE